MPYHDVGALALAHRVAKALKPDVIVFIGDWADCYSISSHAKTPNRLANLQSEIQVATEKLDDFRGLSDARVFCEGNHEFRLDRYIEARAPELFGLVTMRELLGVEKTEWVPYREIKRIGKCAFTHDVGHAGKLAIGHSLAAYGGNLVFGHTHRGGTAYDGNMRGESHFALNVGWLGDLSAINYTYKTVTKSWQHGVGLVEQDGQGNSWGTFAPFVGRKCVIAGLTVI